MAFARDNEPTKCFLRDFQAWEEKGMSEYK